jgi:hypothetical protein
MVSMRTGKLKNDFLRVQQRPKLVWNQPRIAENGRSSTLQGSRALIFGLDYGTLGSTATRIQSSLRHR